MNTEPCDQSTITPEDHHTINSTNSITSSTTVFPIGFFHSFLHFLTPDLRAHFLGTLYDIAMRGKIECKSDKQNPSDKKNAVNNNTDQSLHNDLVDLKEIVFNDITSYKDTISPLNQSNLRFICDLKNLESLELSFRWMNHFQEIIHPDGHSTQLEEEENDREHRGDGGWADEPGGEWDANDDGDVYIINNNNNDNNWNNSSHQTTLTCPDVITPFYSLPVALQQMTKLTHLKLEGLVNPRDASLSLLEMVFNPHVNSRHPSNISQYSDSDQLDKMLDHYLNNSKKKKSKKNKFTVQQPKHLFTLPSLTHLDIKNNRLNLPQTFKFLFNSTSFPSVQELEIKNHYFDLYADIDAFDDALYAVHFPYPDTFNSLKSSGSNNPRPPFLTSLQTTFPQLNYIPFEIYTQEEWDRVLIQSECFGELKRLSGLPGDIKQDNLIKILQYLQPPLPQNSQLANNSVRTTTTTTTTTPAIVTTPLPMTSSHLEKIDLTNVILFNKPEAILELRRCVLSNGVKSLNLSKTHLSDTIIKMLFSSMQYDSPSHANPEGSLAPTNTPSIHHGDNDFYDNLASLTTLSLSENDQLTTETIHTLLHSPNLTNLTTLDISSCPNITLDGIITLIQSSNLPNLKTLHIGLGGQISRGTTALKEKKLWEEFFNTLINSPNLAKLESLCITCNIDGHHHQFIPLLGKSPHLNRLNKLILIGLILNDTDGNNGDGVRDIDDIDGIDDEHVRTRTSSLTQSTQFFPRLLGSINQPSTLCNLQTLALRDCNLNEIDITELFESSYLNNITHLELMAIENLDDESIKTLAISSQLSQLTRLELTNNITITSKVYDFINSSTFASNLKWLGVWGTRVNILPDQNNHLEHDRGQVHQQGPDEDQSKPLTPKQRLLSQGDFNGFICDYNAAYF